jgi:hypothetical protein
MSATTSARVLAVLVLLVVVLMIFLLSAAGMRPQLSPACCVVLLTFQGSRKAQVGRIGEIASLLASLAAAVRSL